MAQAHRLSGPEPLPAGARTLPRVPRARIRKPATGRKLRSASTKCERAWRARRTKSAEHRLSSRSRLPLRTPAASAARRRASRRLPRPEAPLSRPAPAEPAHGGDRGHRRRRWRSASPAASCTPGARQVRRSRALMPVSARHRSRIGRRSPAVSYGLMAAGAAGTAGGISWYLLGGRGRSAARRRRLVIQGSARF